MNVKNIVISGTNFWNPGDDFVRLGVIRVLKELFIGYHLNFLFYNFNADFFPQSKFMGISNLAAKGDLNKYKNYIDAVVITGLSAGNEIKDLYQWVIDNGLQDRVYLIGAGYENNYVDTFIKTEPELTIFKNARVITGRTKKTPGLIQRMNLPYNYINCPAILSVKNVKEIPVGKRIKKIGFSIQLPPAIGVVNHVCAQSMYALAIEALRSLMADYDIEVIAHHKSEYFYFTNLFDRHNIQIPVLFSSFFEDLFAIYPNYDCVITTRLHASLFANGYGIPGIVLNDTARHTHCLEQFPHSVWVNNKESFIVAFNNVLNKDLRCIAEEAELFKQKLMRQYLDVLTLPFGMKADDKNNNDHDVYDIDFSDVPVHFFTIVLNGEPFIRHHIEVFNKLPFRWHWHIIEGVADLTHDTSWSLQTGGRIGDKLHSEGRSNDGTSEYLNELARRYPEQITLYRKPRGIFWDGKIEMVNAPLKNINETCLLFQVDADELWTSDQLLRVYKMFAHHPEKTAAYYFCNYFVGEDLVTTTRNAYGNHMSFEWLRTWRYTPGNRWISHEPPRLCMDYKGGQWRDIAMIDPFKHADTEKEGLIFQHYAYVIKEQLGFKELYYGYAGAVEKWLELQDRQEFPVLLKNYFPWVQDDATVNTRQSQTIYPIAIKNICGRWRFRQNEPQPDEIRTIAWVRTDSIGDNVLAASMLPYVRKKFNYAVITIICQEHNAPLYQCSPYVDRIVTYNRLRLIKDSLYRDQIIQRLRIVDTDLVLNSVYSREAITDLIVAYCGTKKRVAFKGDVSNYGDNIDNKENNDKIYSTLLLNDTETIPEIQRHREFLTALEIHTDSLEPQMWTSNSDREFAENFFKGNNLDDTNVIALFPGARHFHKEYNQYDVVLKGLTGYSLLVLGGMEVYQKGETLCRYSSGKSWNLAGKTTIPQMAELVRKCRLYVGSDSAGAHIACAVHTPNVVILGGGHFGRFIPYSYLTSAVCLPLSCYRCNWQCPYKSVPCINNINPETVMKAIRETLQKKSARPRLFVQGDDISGYSYDHPQWKWDEAMIKKNDAEIIPVGFCLHNEHQEIASNDIVEDRKALMNNLKLSLSKGHYNEAMGMVRTYLEKMPDDCTIASISNNLERLCNTIS